MNKKAGRIFLIEYGQPKNHYLVTTTITTLLVHHQQNDL